VARAARLSPCAQVEDLEIGEDAKPDIERHGVNPDMVLFSHHPADWIRRLSSRRGGGDRSYAEQANLRGPRGPC
jgi:hypothetical protein